MSYPRTPSILAIRSASLPGTGGMPARPHLDGHLLVFDDSTLLVWGSLEHWPP